MQLVTPLARPLLASMFVVGGLDAMLHAEGKVKFAEYVTRPLSERFDFIPQDTETLVRVNGATQLFAGIALALGKLTRLSSLALIMSIIPTTLAGHRFWEATSDEERAQQRVHFLKNAGLLGGLLLSLAAGSSRRKPREAARTRRHAAYTERHERKADRAPRKVRAGRFELGAVRRWPRLLPAK